MGHIQDRGKTRASRWQARYIGTDGRERSQVFSRKIDAEGWLTTNEHRVNTGEWVDPTLGQVPLGDYADKWITTKVNVRERTLINIEGRLANHIKPALGKRPLRSIRQSDVRALVATLSTKLSPGTIKSVLLTLSQVLDSAVADGYLTRNACAGVKVASCGQPAEMHFLSASQVVDLAEAIAPRFRAMILTAAYTGLRAGELGAIRVDRLNLLRGSLDVVDSLSEVHGRLVVGPTKTGARRSVSLPRFLQDELAAHLSEYPSVGYVFTAAEGGPVRHRNFYHRHFRPAVKAARLLAITEKSKDPIPAGLRFHDLRHTCVALLIAQGAHPKAIQERLGHSTIRLTFDRYGHLLPSLDEQLVKGLDATWKHSLTERRRNAGGILRSLDAHQEAG